MNKTVKLLLLTALSAQLLAVDTVPEGSASAKKRNVKKRVKATVSLLKGLPKSTAQTIKRRPLLAVWGIAGVIGLAEVVTRVLHRNTEEGAPYGQATADVNRGMFLNGDQIPQEVLDESLRTWEEESYRRGQQAPTHDVRQYYMPVAARKEPADCNVCQEALASGLVSLSECNHIFHRECIDRWLPQHPTCPICRTSYANAQ